MRTSAVRIAERWLGEPNSPIQAAVLKLDRRSGLAGARAARGVAGRDGRRTERDGASRRCCRSTRDDPVAMDAALSGARGSEPAILEKLLQSERRADGRARGGDRDGERDHHSRRSGCVRPDDAGDGRRCESSGVAAVGGASRRRGGAGAEHADAGNRAAWCRAVDHGDRRGHSGCAVPDLPRRARRSGRRLRVR